MNINLMKPRRIDRRWRELAPGDQFFTRRPLHELERVAETLKPEGLDYQFIPAPGGYLIERTEEGGA